MKKSYIFSKHLKKTFWNKAIAIAMILCALIPVFADKDGTALIFVLMFALPMFFAKENLTWIESH